MEAENAMVSIRVEELTNQIALKDKAVGELEHKVAQYVVEISTLRGELEDIQNAEPVQPELESEPLVINLRGQVAKLTAMFTLATDTVALQGQEIDALKGKVKLWEEVAGEWKGAYDRERQLRVQAESLFRLCERGQRLNKFWRTTAVVATGAVAGLLLLK